MGLFLCFVLDFFMLVASMTNGWLDLVPMWYFWIIPILIIIGYFASWRKSISFIPTKKECPICKSTNVDINFVGTGAVGVNVGYGIGVAATTNAKVAICKDCGASFGFTAQNDVWAVQSSRKKRFIFFVVFFVAIVLVGKIYYDKNADSRELRRIYAEQHQSESKR